MEGQGKVRKRTRDGCWTCRRRKKKCDGVGIPCANCTRLGLECENQVRLVWEDDTRRVGMKRRGPAASVKTGLPKDGWKVDVGGVFSSPRDFSDHPEHGSTKAGGSLMPLPAVIVRYNQMSTYPRHLDSTEHLLLDRYIQRFSREYPTCSGPSNPFLTVFIPLAMKCAMVLDSLLALSGAQRWQHGSASMERESLRLRQQALQGARKVLLSEGKDALNGNKCQLLPGDHSSIANSQKAVLLRGLTSTSEENLLFLLTSSVLFLLYEKVSGEATWKPHMKFISQFFEHSLPLLAINPRKSPEVSEAVRFLHEIFVYNDLVRSTSLKTKPLSNFYLMAATPNGIRPSPLETAFFPSGEDEQIEFRRRYYFPSLIARLSAGDISVTEQDIALWDGSLGWLPSFALDRSESKETDEVSASSKPLAWNDRTIITELYRTAASIYRRQTLKSWTRDTAPFNRVDIEVVDQPLSQLANVAHFLMISLPEDSTYENALLWPIGIVAKELTIDQPGERSNVLLRLRALETRFQMRHFRKVQDVLLRHWAYRDGSPSVDELQSEEDAILLG